MVGSEARMRESSVISPLRRGTLKSTRTSTRRPASSGTGVTSETQKRLSPQAAMVVQWRSGESRSPMRLPPMLETAST